MVEKSKRNRIELNWRWNEIKRSINTQNKQSNKIWRKMDLWTNEWIIDYKIESIEKIKKYDEKVLFSENFIT